MRIRFQFSLLTLLLVFVAVGLGLWIIDHRYRWKTVLFGSSSRSRVKNSAPNTLPSISRYLIQKGYSETHWKLLPEKVRNEFTDCAIDQDEQTERRVLDDPELLVRQSSVYTKSLQNYGQVYFFMGTIRYDSLKLADYHQVHLAQRFKINAPWHAKHEVQDWLKRCQAEYDVAYSYRGLAPYFGLSGREMERRLLNGEFENKSADERRQWAEQSYQGVVKERGKPFDWNDP